MCVPFGNGAFVGPGTASKTRIIVVLRSAFVRGRETIVRFGCNVRNSFSFLNKISVAASEKFVPNKKFLLEESKRRRSNRCDSRTYRSSATTPTPNRLRFVLLRLSNYPEYRASSPTKHNGNVCTSKKIQFSFFAETNSKLTTYSQLNSIISRYADR